MLNLGLIGDIKLLEPYAKKARENPEIHITGKSSVGTQPLPDSFRLQPPEFNRIELIERSDILFINRFSLLPFDLLCEMVKKSKHIFATTYPDLSNNEIAQLLKLAHEAKTVIQLANPYYYQPEMQLMAENLKKPAFVNVSNYGNESVETNVLLKLLLMLKDIADTIPKKISAVLFRSAPANSLFHNVQLEFGDGSVINLSFGKMDDHKEFKINLYRHNHFSELDFIHENYSVNNIPIDSSELATSDETETFLNSVLQKRKAVTHMETYAIAMQIMNMIQKKLERYSSF